MGIELRELTTPQQVALSKAQAVAKAQLDLAMDLTMAKFHGLGGPEARTVALSIAQVLATNYLAEGTKTASAKG